MILSSHGIIGSIGTFIPDADAQAFFERVDTATSTTDFLTTTEKTAINKLVLDLKANSLWTPMKAIYPMVGGGTGTTAQRQAACAQNLKSSSFTGIFSATGWTFTSFGAKGDGTQAGMDTNLNSNTELNINSTHISYYSNENWTNGDMLMSNGSLNLLLEQTSTIFYSSLATVSFSQVTNSLKSALFMINRQNSTNQKLIKNKTILLNDAKNSSSFTSSNVFLNKYLNLVFSNARCAFSSIGNGLTDNEAENLYDAVQAFQTTLSRQV
jgi:hypothetical protein